MDQTRAIDYFVYITLRAGTAMIARRIRSTAWDGHPSNCAEKADGRADVVTMTSTEARKAFGRLLEIVGRGGVVRIKKYGIVQAVAMSVNRYQALTGVSDPAPDLDA